MAQLYLTPPKSDVSPKLKLIAFQRVHLAAGESKQLQFTLDPRQLSVVDDKGKRSVTAGNYTLSLGGGQPDSVVQLGARTDTGVSAKLTIDGKKTLAQ